MTYLAQIFFHTTPNCFGQREPLTTIFSSPPISAKKKKNLSNNLIVIIQLFFFSPFLHFGNETAIIKPFFSSPLYFDNDILTIQFYFSLSSLLLFSLLISVRSISVKSVGQHKNWVDISVRYCQNHLFSLFLSVTSFLSPLSYIFSQFRYTIVEIHLFSHYTYHK